MGARRKSREMAAQILYQIEMSGEEPAAALELFRDHFEASAKAVPYAQELVLGVYANWDAINQRIATQLENWRTERMSVVDRNILRVAVCEMLYLAGVPGRVAINEAIEVAKKFGSEESGAFINGILDAIRRSAETLADQGDAAALPALPGKG